MTDFGEDITEEVFQSSGRDRYEKLILSDTFFDGIKPFNNKRVLEIGCGTGRITEFLGDDFQEVCGVDISEVMVEKAKKRLVAKNNIKIYATDGMNYPFENAFFDVVFSFIVFQHMPDHSTVKKNLQEIARVLKPGGLAKIQFRGLPTKKGEWYYGYSCSLAEIQKMIRDTSLKIFKTEGELQRYFWAYFSKE